MSDLIAFITVFLLLVLEFFLQREVLCSHVLVTSHLFFFVKKDEVHFRACCHSALRLQVFTLLFIITCICLVGWERPDAHSISLLFLCFTLLVLFLLLKVHWFLTQLSSDLPQVRLCFLLLFRLLKSVILSQSEALLLLRKNAGCWSWSRKRGPLSEVRLSLRIVRQGEG